MRRGSLMTREHVSPAARLVAKLTREGMTPRARILHLRVTRNLSRKVTLIISVGRLVSIVEIGQKSDVELFQLAV